MKVNRNLKVLRPVGSFSGGESFRCGDDVYMRTDTTTHIGTKSGIGFATNLENGVLTSFGVDRMVEPVEAEVNIV